MDLAVVVRGRSRWPVVRHGPGGGARHCTGPLCICKLGSRPVDSLQPSPLSRPVIERQAPTFESSQDRQYALVSHHYAPSLLQVSVPIVFFQCDVQRTRVPACRAQNARAVVRRRGRGTRAAAARIPEEHRAQSVEERPRRIRPPPGGAQLVDPRMRNSGEFAAWLNSEETKQKLQGKEVLMYCTGGIRCERATALLNKMTSEDDGFKVQGVSHVRGGIERYLKTFPSGGYWTGMNYLFDRRQEQLPENHNLVDLAGKPMGSDQLAEAIAGEVLSRRETTAAAVEPPQPKCCVCARPYALYRGQFHCAMRECKVPVIVCPACAPKCSRSLLRCPLCTEGYTAPKQRPAFLRKAAMETDATAKSETEFTQGSTSHVGTKFSPNRRIFFGKLPLHVHASTLREYVVRCCDGAVNVERVLWAIDPSTCGFYGSAFVELSSDVEAERVLSQASLVLDKQLAALSRCKKRKRRRPSAGAEDNPLWALKLLGTQKRHPANRKVFRASCASSCAI
ncbi:thiosulfate sulfurtransferase [Pseudoscourfieldia marina]